MFVNEAVVNGKKYKFQHPGNREWVKLQSQMLNLTTRTYEWEKLLDYCFEHVVIPVEGNKLDLDTIPVQDVEVWQMLLPRFLRGELDNGYVYPEDRKSKREGEKLLQEESKK